MPKNCRWAELRSAVTHAPDAHPPHSVNPSRKSSTHISRSTRGRRPRRPLTIVESLGFPNKRAVPGRPAVRLPAPPCRRARRSLRSLYRKRPFSPDRLPASRAGGVTDGLGGLRPAVVTGQHDSAQSPESRTHLPDAIVLQMREDARAGGWIQSREGPAVAGNG